MKHFTLIHPQHPGRHRLLLLVLLGVLTISAHAFGADIQPNDEVHLTRDTPLLFLDKPLRQGTAGEAFKVLAYRPEQKKVFLAIKDPAGKEIAVSVAEESVSLVPADKAAVQAAVLAAVSRQQYAAAKAVLGQALRASPDDVGLHSVSIALDAVVIRATRLKQATDAQRSIDDDVKRRRHNADVTDHPNPLDANDQSGRRRAQEIRTGADKIAAESDNFVRLTRNDYDAAVSALTAITRQVTSEAASKLSTSLPRMAGAVPRPKLTITPGPNVLSDAPVPKTGVRSSDPFMNSGARGMDASNGRTDEKSKFDEAVKLDPELIDVTSDFHKAFERIYKELSDARSTLFDDSNWPLIIAKWVKWEAEEKARYNVIKRPEDPPFSPPCIGRVFSEGSYVDLLVKFAGPQYKITIIKKLSFSDFPGIKLPPAARGLYQFETVDSNTDNDHASGILITIESDFKSAGLAKVNFLPSQSISVERFDGFAQRTVVYIESSNVAVRELSRELDDFWARENALLPSARK